MPQDKYDEAIAYLEKNPGKIQSAWNFPHKRGGCLFSYVGRVDAASRGCLTQIKVGRAVAITPKGKEDKKLTAEIRADERLPSLPEDISVEDLPVFAEWQRRLDDVYPDTFRYWGRCRTHEGN